MAAAPAPNAAPEAQAAAPVTPKAPVTRAPPLAMTPALSRILSSAGVGASDQASMRTAQTKAMAANDDAADVVKKNTDKINAIIDEPREPLPELPKTAEFPKPYEAPKQESPLRVMGEFLPVLAMLGGVFVKNNSTAALNAASSAIEAAKKNDQAALEKHHQEWLDSMDYAIKDSEFQAKNFKMILDRRGVSESEKQSALTALSASSNNAHMQAAIASGNYDLVYKGADMMLRAATTLREHMDRVASMNADPKRQAFNDFKEQYRKEHNGQDPSAEEEAKFLQQTSGFSSRAAQAQQSAFYKIPVVHNFQVIQGQWPRMKTAVDQIQKNPEAKRDQALQLDILDTYIQMANGGRQVTEAQVHALAGQPGILPGLDKMYESVQRGQFLTGQQVDSIIHQAGELHKHAEDAMAPVIQDQIAIAQARGIDESEVIPQSWLEKYAPQSADGAAGGPDAAETHAELPDPAQYKGYTATDENGQEMVSDGTKWVPASRASARSGPK